MKISYIIMPFEEDTYVVRCVNSLYRQPGTDYEVILAENVFGDNAGELRAFLDEKSRLARISGEEKSFSEKMASALRLVSADSDYVMFIEADTVVSPVAAQAILKNEKSDLIFPCAAVKEADGFVRDRMDWHGVFQNIENYPPQRFCFAAAFFGEDNPRGCFQEEFFEDHDSFFSFLFSLYAKGTTAHSTEDVCIYVEKFSVGTAAVEDSRKAFARAKENIDMIWNNFSRCNDIRIQTEIFDRLTFRLMEFMGSEVEEVRHAAYEAMQEVCGRVSSSLFFRRLFELKTCCEAEVFSGMGLEEYEIYRERLPGAGAAAIDAAGQEKMFQEIKIAMGDVKKDICELSEGLSSLTKDFSALEKSSQITMASLAQTQPQTFRNPAIEVPALYREGRLGFRTIWRSLEGWLKHKLSGE